MKLIHCSDIHLDSPMESNLSPAQARERNAEILATFIRMIGYARENGVEVILLAGDLFDSRRAAKRTAQLVLDQIRQSPEVDFLYLRGNHDETADPFSGLKLPENFKTFQKTWSSYRYGDVVITAAEPATEDWEGIYDSLELDGRDINIVMLHGQEATQPGREKIALPRLKNRHIRYLALGHIHSHKLEKLDLEGEYAYCGCLEGRGFDECGPKGFVLLESDGKELKIRFVPFAKRTLHHIPVDITDMITAPQILTAMQTLASDIPGEDLVKFTLTGSYTLETQKDPEFLERMLEGRFYFVKIKDESRLKIRQEDYAHDVSLKGEFVRLVLASERSEEEKERMICWGIRALSGEEVGL